MIKYKCVIDGVDCLKITKHEDGINFNIHMRGKNEDDFDNSCVILDYDQIKSLINELQNLIKNG